MISQEMLGLGSARSCIRELFEYGRLRAQEVGPENVMDFSLGNPSVPAPPEVEAAIRQLLDRESAVALHGYTSAPGIEETRAAVAASLNRRYNAGIEVRHVFMMGGAAATVIACLKAVAAGPRSEVVVIAPHFPEYKVYVESSAGARLRVVPADTEQFQINFEALAETVGADTRAVIINSPNNPSGTVYTRQTLERLADLLREKSAELGREIYLISDEPYRELAYGGVEVPYVPALYANTLICYSYSKSLSLPGERIGYVVVPPGVQKAGQVFDAVAGAARAIGHVCAPSLMQRVVALCADVQPDVTVYEHNSRLLYEGMTRMGYRCARPDGAFYIFFEAPCGLTGKAFSDLAKERYNLLIVPGDDFGCPNHLRLAYCVPTARVEQALPYLEKLMAEAKAGL